MQGLIEGKILRRWRARFNAVPSNEYFTLLVRKEANDGTDVDVSMGGKGGKGMKRMDGNRARDRGIVNINKPCTPTDT